MSALGPITVTLGVGALAAVALSHVGARARDDHDDALVAWGLVWVWCVGVAARVLTPEFFPDIQAQLYLWSGPLIDLMFGWFVLHIYLQRRPNSGWKTVLLGLTAGQIAAHLLFGLAPKSATAIYAYKASLNLTYVGQLICAAAPGLRHAARRLAPQAQQSRQGAE